MRNCSKLINNRMRSILTGKKNTKKTKKHSGQNTRIKSNLKLIQILAEINDKIFRNNKNNFEYLNSF